MDATVGYPGLQDEVTYSLVASCLPGRANFHLFGGYWAASATHEEIRRVVVEEAVPSNPCIMPSISPSLQRKRAFRPW